MGSWSSHPMGNDSALDGELYILEEAGLFDPKKPNAKYTGKFTEKDIPKLLEGIKKLKRRKDTKDLVYVLPWLIHEKQIKIKDKTLSRKVKELILLTPERSIRPKKGEKSTSVYTKNLYKNWDKMMSGEVSFNAVTQDEGLITKMMAAERKKEKGMER